MKIKIFTVIGMVAVTLLVACSSDTDSSASDEKEAENIKEMVQDYTIGNLKAESASITDKHLIVTDSNSDEGKVAYSLPEDEFFVSIAPYVNKTHT